MIFARCRLATAGTISRRYAAASGRESGPRRLTTSARVLSLQSSMRMYTFAASSKHRANRTTRPSRTARWMRISVRILARARGFSSVLLATTLAA